MKKLFWLAAALATGVALTACGGGGGDTPIIATQDATATISASNGQQATTPILNKDFSFSTGVAALKTTGPTTLTLKPRTPTTLPDTQPAGNPEFNLSSAQGTATGVVQFGSCTFIVNSSTIPGLPVGSSITVANCSLTYDTSGKEVNTTASVGVLLTLDNAVSQPIAITVTLSATGQVSVNGTPTGATSPTGTATGSSGT